MANFVFFAAANFEVAVTSILAATDPNMGGILKDVMLGDELEGIRSEPRI